MPGDGHSNAGKSKFNEPRLPREDSLMTEQSAGESIPSWLPTVPNMQIDTRNASRDPMHLQTGQLYDDFFVRSQLGRGAFGVVYLAEQLSLRRTVALKVTDITRQDGGEVEGQTMAQLEHPSIVRVFLQMTDDTNGRRLLCMQYVPGMNLRLLMRNTLDTYGNRWKGIHLLKILEDQVDTEYVNLSETAISDREELMRADKHAAICWIGSEAAFALDHAHRAGYIHRDVKPENTIMSRFGRPMLVDFNLAMATQLVDRGVVGGTIPYMSPESITEFASSELSSEGCRFDADVYSLGVMLWELATFNRPFKSFSSKSILDAQSLQELLESRRIDPQASDDMCPILDQTLRRAFCFDASLRYDSAREFALTLDGCAKQHEVFKEQANHGWLGNSVVKRPVPWLVGAALLPHVAASGLQIAYNQAEIVDQLNDKARGMFHNLLYVVNPVAYGVCIVVALLLLLRMVQPWVRLRRRDNVDDQEIEKTRKNLLSLPRICATIGAWGWLCGAIAFPGTIWFFAQRFSYDIWLHFVGSFAISCAIAVTFSYALVLAIVIYGMYPSCFATPIQFVSESIRQLSPFRDRWISLSVLAGLIPLATAILVVAFFQPADLISYGAGGQSEFAFKGLVIGLILASACGFGIVRRIGQVITRFIDKCTGTIERTESDLVEQPIER